MSFLKVAEQAVKEKEEQQKRKQKEEITHTIQFDIHWKDGNLIYIMNNLTTGESTILKSVSDPFKKYYNTILEERQNRALKQFPEILNQIMLLKDQNLKLARENDSIKEFRQNFFQCEICKLWWDVRCLYEPHHDGIAQGRNNLPEYPWIADWEPLKHNTIRMVCVFCHEQTSASLFKQMSERNKKKIQLLKKIPKITDPFEI